MRNLRATSPSSTQGKPAATNAAALDTKFFAFSNMLIVDPSCFHVAILLQSQSHPACRDPLMLLALKPVCSHPLANVTPLLHLVRHCSSRFAQTTGYLAELVVRLAVHHVKVRHSDEVPLSVTVRTVHLSSSQCRMWHSHIF